MCFSGQPFLMGEKELALPAVCEAQRILENYLQPRPQNNERRILDQLMEVLERPDLVVAVGRLLHRSSSELGSMMTQPLASITLAALLTALSSIEVSIAQARQQCSAASPSDQHGQWWSYRMFDGRKCWYEGKPGLSKSLLEWPREGSPRPASSEEVRSTAPEKPRTPLDSQAWAPNSKASVPSDPDPFEARWLPRTGENATSVTDA